MVFCKDHGIALGKNGRRIAHEQRKGKCLEERLVYLCDFFVKELSICSDGHIIVGHPDGVNDFRKILFHRWSHGKGNPSEVPLDTSFFRLKNNINAVKVFLVGVKAVIRQFVLHKKEDQDGEATW